MSGRIIEVPDGVRQKAEILGAEGLRWLSSLADLIGELERNWNVIAGPSLHGGSEAYVAKATTKDGSEVVLKINMPQMNGNTVFANEVQALTIADGHGYVRLLEHDFSRRALLLERLGVPLRDLGLPTRTQIEIICATLKKTWVHIPPASQLHSGTSVPDGYSEFIVELWGNLDSPCSKRALDTALSFTQARAAAFDPETAVLVHGDAHNGNTLQNLSQKFHTQSPFKFIDPDGIEAEPAYDLGILMREWSDELLEGDPVRLGRKRCAYLGYLTGVNTQAIWEWGFIQCMSTGLFLMQLGNERLGSQLLKIADAWAEE